MLWDVMNAGLKRRRARSRAVAGHCRRLSVTVLIYKIHPAADWADAERAGTFLGAPIDLADGYIHFSTGAQARETAAKHFAGQPGLLLIALEAAALGTALVWEPSRGGALFPHLYGPLSLAAVRWVMLLPLQADGSHAFAEDVI
jgi:uncharacterized protein (DUF952 family)